MATRLTPQQRALRQVLENSLQRNVEDYAQSAGWRYYHAPDNRPVTSRTGRKYVQNVRGGWPDLVLVKHGRLVVLELKTEVGKYKPGQVEWLLDLQAAGVEVAVVRPRDLQAVHRWLVLGERLPTYAPPPNWTREPR